MVKRVLGHLNCEIEIEPGRLIAGNAGILVSQVIYVKEGEDRKFLILDAAMNDLIRPAMYEAHHDIIPVVEADAGSEKAAYDIVGPVCETGDFLGKERELALHDNSLLAVMSSGAYGFVMSSNYNTRPRPVELMVDGSAVHVVREREQVKDLFAGETLLPG